MTPSLLAVAFVLAQAATPNLTPTTQNVGQGVLSGAWQLKDGVLSGHASAGETAWYRFPGDYRDFEFEIEFKATAMANSGVQFRAHWLPKMSAEGAGPKSMYGYQANIDTGDLTHTGEILIRHGEPPLSAATKDAAAAVKPGDWNLIRVRANGPVADVSINGVLAATAYDESFIGGLIGLQVQGSESAPAEVQFRNPKLTVPSSTEWRALFDGKTLTGWKIYGTEVFQVNNGVIECRRGPKESEGYLATEEEFSSFRVRGQFKMLGDGNYGLFYHSHITLRPEDGYPVIAGVQGEVEPSWPGSTGWVYESYRRGWLLKPDPAVPAAALLRVGDWNEIEIRSQGNHLTTWVNGMRVIEWLDPSPQLFSGSFALQLHTGAGAGVDWKELYVTQP